MEERSLEIKVGLLVLLGLVGVLALLWLMGELRFSRGTELLVRFGHTGNVVKGAPVKLGGVRVGRVDEIELQPSFRTAEGLPLPVLMHLDVEPATAGALHTDAQAAVATQGPLGEAYLELQAGSPGAPLVKPGDTLRGKEPFRIDQVISRLGNLLNTATDSLGKNPESIPRLITSLGKLTDKLNQALDENPQALSELIAELAGTVKELHAIAADAHTSLQPGGKGAAFLADAAASAKTLRKELPGLTQDARHTLQGLEAVTGQLSEEDGRKLKQAIAHYAEAGRHLDQLAARADKLSAELDAGKGSLGGLLKDPELYQDAKDLVKELKKHPWRILWKD